MFTRIIHCIKKIFLWFFRIVKFVVLLPLMPFLFIKKVVVGEKTGGTEEQAFRADSVAGALQEASHITLVATTLGTGLIVIAIIWASNAKLDEITRGVGTVIPSSRLQVVQNLEGGIIEKIFIKEGQAVDKDQPLIQLDAVHFESKYKENQQSYFGEWAKVVRLRAEVDNKDLTFPENLKSYTDFINREREIFVSRKKVLKSEMEIIEQEVNKITSEIESAKSQYRHLKESKRFLMEEYNLTAPMVEEGAVSRVQLLRLDQRISELGSQISDVEHKVPKLRSSLSQERKRMEEARLQFIESALEELKATELKLAQLREGKSSLEDRVTRTVVRSPVSGIIQKLYVNTIGGVVNPGMDLVDIVPANDALIVEVKVPAKDIAFMRKGLKAMVRFAAYDFTIYGGLTGQIVRVSADAVTDEQGNYFYLASIKTDESYFNAKGKKMPIIPGMQADVDIITGKKTVLDYLLKPITKAMSIAMTER